MQTNRITTFFIAVLATCLVAVGCKSGGEFPGREYMPDMGHSVAYEANHFQYYGTHNWSSKAKTLEMSQPRLPVEGTVPRGYAGVAAAGAAGMPQAMEEFNAAWYPQNGAVTYPYGDTDADRDLASAEITSNPFPATTAGLESGEELYAIYCGICHGEDGDGNGSLYNGGDGPYPAKPTSYIDGELLEASDGRMYHAIMRGKGVMGAYADKLSYEERWNVIHYIRSLQAESQGFEYAVTDAIATPPMNVSPVEESLDEQIQRILDMRSAGDNSAPSTINLKNVFFETGSAALKGESFVELDKLVNILKGNSGFNVEIAGHTDNVGTPASNKTLSEQRALSVVKYLVDHGIGAERLSGVGYGDTKPVADNATAEGKAQNRRTEFIIK